MESEKYEDAAQYESWMKAIKDELSMIENNATWELVDKPTNKPIIGVNGFSRPNLILMDMCTITKRGLLQKDMIKNQE